MRGRYTLEWLDSLITVSLNPEITNVTVISDLEIKSIIDRLGEEKNKQKSLLINYIFSLTEEKHIKLLLKQYHSTLVVLLDQALENSKRLPNNCILSSAANELILCVDELLSFIEARFSNYLDANERIPITYHAVKKEELKPRLKKLKDMFIEKNVDNEIRSIILKTFYSFIDHPPAATSVTFQEVTYLNELLRAIELLEDPTQTDHVYSTLDDLLIYLNFNCKDYINYFRKVIEEKISSVENTSEKMDTLLFYSKEFNQMCQKSGVALNPQENGLKEEIGNWFRQEILYLEKKNQHVSIPLETENGNLETVRTIKEENHKVLCTLSTDQTALILRAATELRVLKSRSLNAMFKTIVPHLSTPHKENLSYDSVRSKSYVAEERDKEKAIEALENIIERINEY